MAGWTADIDFSDTTMRKPSDVMPDIIKAINERCDAAYIRRPFLAPGCGQDGRLTTVYSGAVTTIRVTYVSLYGQTPPSTSVQSGYLTYSMMGIKETIRFTAQIGILSNYRDFTVDATLVNSWLYGGSVIVYRDIEPDDLQLLSSSLVCGEIDSKITELLGVYADHTQATGTEFVSKTSIPAWTEANMLTHISALSRIFGGANDTISPAWVDQVYKIINALKWVRHDAGGSPSGYTYPIGIPFFRGFGQNGAAGFSTTWQEKAASGYTWTAIEAAWPVGWSSLYYIPWIYSAAYFNSFEEFFTIRNVINYGYHTFLAKNHESDLYLYTELLGLNPAIGDEVDNPEYYNEGLNIEQDKFGRIVSNPSSLAVYETLDIQAAMDSTVPNMPSQPTAVYYVTSADGIPNGAYSGAITSVTLDMIDFAGDPVDPGNLSPTGVLAFYDYGDGDEDYIAYTAVSGSGTTRTFTVNDTLIGSYTPADTYVNVLGDYASDPAPRLGRGWADSAVAEYCPVVVLRFDVVGGFEYVG